MKTQILGTQIIGPKYHFTDTSPVLEGAKRIFEMGSNTIKIKYVDWAEFCQIANIGFDHVLFWHHGCKFDAGFDEGKLYQSTLDIALGILQTYHDADKTFYLGHWEGDWLLNPPEKSTEDAPKEKIEAMISIINTRQRAIEFAKYAYPNAKVRLYHYVEINRVVDALELGLARYVNAVLPRIHPDLISYSAYDSQRKSKQEIHRILDYIEGRLTPKPGLPFAKRVFIGEFGIPASAVGYDSQRHLIENLTVIEKFASWGCPFVLYWEFYNNEIAKDGTQIGYWLIDNQNQPWPLYDFYREFYRLTHSFSRPFDIQTTLTTMIKGATQP